MFRLGPVGIKRLRWLHLASVWCWFGGVIALNLLFLFRSGVTDSAWFYGTNVGIYLVCVAVIVPCSFANLLTGCAYALMTDRGYSEQFWLKAKLVLTAFLLIPTALFLVHSSAQMMDQSRQLGGAAVASTAYAYSQQMGLVFGWIQIIALLALVLLSIFKPGETEGRPISAFRPYIEEIEEVPNVAASSIAEISRNRESWVLFKGGKVLSRQEFIMRGVDEILFYVWDPIGVSPEPFARDEYENYVEPVYELLMAGGNEKAIAALLDRISTEMMEIGPCSSAAEAAEEIISIKDFAEEML